MCTANSNIAVTTKKFLVLVDSFSSCTSALFYAVEQALVCNASVCMLCVVEETGGQGDVLWPTLSAGMRQDSLEAAGDVLVSLAAEVWNTYAIEVTYKILEGNYKQSIFAHIEEHKCSYVIYTGIGVIKRFVGAINDSLSSGVLMKYRCPVVIVPDEESMKALKS